MNCEGIDESLDEDAYQARMSELIKSDHDQKARDLSLGNEKHTRQVMGGRSTPRDSKNEAEGYV